MFTTLFPAAVRTWIYRAQWIGSPIVIYLAATEVIGTAEVALWAAYVTATGFLADANTTDTPGR